jgi:hypothetical protein
MTDIRRPLPIGISSLQTIIDNGMAYVDKTAHAYELSRLPGRYFLSRPRRFGKSLFVDTLKQLFEGNEPLFQGLYIHDRWDWSRRFPTIKLDFAGGVLDSREALDHRIYALLQENAERLGLVVDPENDIAGAFGTLIRHARETTGQQAAILVDEYDKPILDNIAHSERAAELREGLKNLYSAMKAQDAHIHCIFMTGVTKFSKVSLFSGVNQLHDITLHARFATLCGYTQADLETTFAAHLAGVDWDELKRWYNGYGFLGEPVYNPFDILQFIDQGCRYRNYWFETGSPEFLIKLFQRHRYFLPNLEAIQASEDILDSFEIERIDPVTLLFQTGYLTIDRIEEAFGQLLFVLRIPNQEVRLALSNQFVDAYTGHSSSQRFGWQKTLYDTLIRGDVSGLVAAIRRLFAGVAWRNFTQNDLPEAEGYYASVLYAFFASLAAEIIPEDISNHGQADLTIKLAGYIYVIEIKVQRGAGKPIETVETDAPAPAPAQSDNPALAQIQARGYSAKYRGLPVKGLFEVGLVFDPAARNLAQADWVAVASDAQP